MTFCFCNVDAEVEAGNSLEHIDRIKTNSGGLVEFYQGFGITWLNELGKIAPYVRKKERGGKTRFPPPRK